MSLLPARMKKIHSKNEGARVVTSLFIDISNAQWAANSEVSDGILPKFKLIQAFIVGLVTCKNEDPSKNDKSGHNISPILSLWGYFQMLKP